MNEEDKKIKECQEYLLIMLKYVDSICEKEKINYSLAFGTMLGACRHKGFIPWDDDADIVLTRDNYDRLITILKSAKLPEDIGIYMPGEHDKFYDFAIRLFYKGKKVRDGKLCNEWYDGIYSYATLDLFVFDSVPDNSILRKWYFFRLKLLYGLAMSKREKIIYAKHGFIEKLGIKVLSMIGRKMNIADLYEKYDKVSKSHNSKTGNITCTNWSPEFFSWLYDVKLYSNYIRTDFEDTGLMISADYRKILTIDYGEDYMIPKKTHQHGDEFLES